MGEIVSEGALRLRRMGSQFPSEDVGGGGSADLLVGLETCTKRKGGNNVGNTIKQRRRLQLRLEAPSIRPSG